MAVYMKKSANINGMKNNSSSCCSLSIFSASKTIFQGVNRDVVGQVMQALYNKVHFRTYWDFVFQCNHYKCTLETCALIVFFQLL